jgi:hypothetical protein
MGRFSRTAAELYRDTDRIAFDLPFMDQARAGQRQSSVATAIPRAAPNIVTARPSS